MAMSAGQSARQSGSRSRARLRRRAASSCFLGERVFPTIGAAHWPLSALGRRVRSSARSHLRFAAAGRLGSETERARAIERMLAGFRLLGGARPRARCSPPPSRRDASSGSPSARRRTRARSSRASATVAWIVLLVHRRRSHPVRRARALPHAPRREHRGAPRARRRARPGSRSRSRPPTARSSPTRRASSTPRSTSRTSAPRARANRRKNIVTGLDEPVKVASFFPQLNEVGREVDSYLNELSRNAPELHRRGARSAARARRVAKDGQGHAGRRHRARARGRRARR